MSSRIEVLLVDIAKCNSRRKPGTHYYRFTFIDPDTLTKYESIIDPDMRNYYGRKWNRIIEDFNPYGIYTVILKESKGATVVNADHQPYLVQRLTTDQLTWLVTKLAEEAK